MRLQDLPPPRPPLWDFLFMADLQLPFPDQTVHVSSSPSQPRSQDLCPAAPSGPFPKGFGDVLSLTSACQQLVKRMQMLPGGWGCGQLGVGATGALLWV